MCDMLYISKQFSLKAQQTSFDGAEEEEEKKGSHAFITYSRVFSVTSVKQIKEP